MRISLLPVLFLFSLLFVSQKISAQVDETDSLALLALYNSTDGANWTDSWDLTQSVSTWLGVGLTDDRVTEISLSNRNLIGNIPADIGNLVSLENLSLHINSLSGVLPIELFNLTSLEILRLSFNNLSGNIPTEIENLASLKELIVLMNDFDGQLPVEIGSLGNLEELVLSYNNFSGTLPDEIGNLSNLELLSVSGNQFHGAIPNTIGALTSLLILNLQDNQFSDLSDLSSLPSILVFEAFDNLFEFDDLLHNVSVLSSYSPQNKFAEIEQVRVPAFASKILLAGTPDDGSNEYQWYVNAVLIEGATGSSYEIHSSTGIEGSYYCLVTNPALPDLTLRRNDIIVSFSITETDSLALMALYNSTDGANWTNPWDLTQPVSTWNGITVESGRVTVIDLESRNLTGNIPNEIGDLDKLRSLLLRSNNLVGSIPATVGDLTSLELIYLESNQLSGAVPSEIAQLSNLIDVYLIDNELSDLPDLSALNLDDFHVSSNSFEFDDLLPNEATLDSYGDQENIGELQSFQLDFDETVQLSVPTPDDGTNEYQWYVNNNQISGASDPTLDIDPDIYSPGTYHCLITNPSLPNLTLRRNDIQISFLLNPADSLALVALYNSTDGANWTNPWDLTQPLSSWGGITVKNGRVTGIDLYYENLVGSLPEELFSLSALEYINLSANNLSGEIPTEIGNLINLRQLYLNNNELTGELPSELGDLTLLENLSLSRNDFSGSIPTTIGNLQNLNTLSLSNNLISGELPSEIGNLINLRQLHLNNNEITGEIPVEIGNLEYLSSLELSYNSLNGELPAEIGNLINLLQLYLNNNEITGEIPVEIGNLEYLNSLELSFNSLNGELPSEIGNLINLRQLYLNNNEITGEIPVEIGNLENLLIIELSHNSITGELPKEIGNLTALADLVISNNSLSGEIPAEISNIENLYTLNLSYNSLSGELSSEIGSLTNLTYLLLHNNSFSGEIPSEIGNLQNLQWLYLSNNSFEGGIPERIKDISTLKVFRLDDNNFSSLPNFSTTSLNRLSVSYNALDFEDLIPNATVFKNMYEYRSQAKLNEAAILYPEEDEVVTLSVETFDDGNNTFQWYKDDFSIEGATEDIYSFTYSAELAGSYSCRISNPAIPSFFLERRNTLIGLDINPVTLSDSIVLKILYEETDGDYWNAGKMWDLDNPVSTYHGVTVSNERVTELLLSNSFFFYYPSLPEDLLLLDSLSSLDLSHNRISSIPDFSQLKTIDELNISNNAIPVWDIVPIVKLAERGVSINYAYQVDKTENFIQTATLGEEIVIKASFYRAELKDDGQNIYSWYRNGKPLEGEIDSVLVFNYTDAKAGVYYCRVTHPAVVGISTESNSVQLNVVPTEVSLNNSIILENQSIATLVGEFSTEDPQEDDEHTYEILNSSGSFLISGNELRSKQVFDFDYQSSYEIYVRSTDSQGNYIERIFTIEIQEEEDSGGGYVADFGGSGRHGAVSFTIGDHVYAGLGDEGDDVLNDFWKYNPTDSSWSAIDSFPGTARKFSVAFVAEGKAYVGLGTNNGFSEFYSDFYEFDPTTDSWAQISDFGGTARYSAVSFDIEGIGYVGTGKDETDETKDFWSYDHSTDTWTQVADLNTAKRQSAVGFSISGKGYVSGGLFVDESQTSSFSDIQEYDPVTDVWTERIDADGINLSFTDATVTATDEIAYIFYGNKRQVTSYNASTNEVEDLDDLFSLGDSRRNGISFNYQGSIYFGLGYYTEGLFDPPVYPTEFYGYKIPVPEENVAPTDIILSNRKVKENSYTTFTQLFAIDSNTSDTHSFSLVSGDGDADNLMFSVNDNQLQLLSFFDYEITNEFSIRLHAEDEEGAFVEKNFLIEVLDVNETPSTLTLSNSSIDDGEAIETIVGILSATDQDEGDSIFTYNVTVGGEYFYVDGDLLKSKVVFDREIQDSYELYLSATDEGGRSFEGRYFISIEIANEAPTDIVLTNNSVDEGMPIGTVVGTLNSTDLNTDDIHTYTIELGSDFFTIEDDQLLTNRVFDFNEVIAFFLEIESTDDRGLSYLKESIQIDINDINDVPTDITLSNLEISENLDRSTIIGDLSVVDHDLEDTHSYKVFSEPGAGTPFYIEESHLLSNVAYDFEEKSSYEITIEVKDNRGATFEKEFIISIIDEEDPLGLNGLVHAISVYPNPADEYVYLQVEDNFVGELSYRILDISGKEIKTEWLYKAERKSSIPVDIQQLKSGTYFILMEIDGVQITRKFIKN